MQRRSTRRNTRPASTPAVCGDSVIAIGFNGRLSCLDKRTGHLRYTLDLMGKFDAKPPRWGYANSPLPFQSHVIIPVGGDDAAFVALDVPTGRVVWRRHNFENSYGSPVLLNRAGLPNSDTGDRASPMMICLMAREVVCLDPRDGRLLWQHPHEGQWLNNIPNPVACDDGTILITSEGDAGSRLLRPAPNGREATVTELWATRKFRVVHRNVIAMDDVAFGSSGDFGPTMFSAIDLKTGDVLWKRRDIERAGLLRVGPHLLMLEENGRLSLTTPSRDGMVIHASAQLLDEKAWTIPTLVGRRLILRDRRSIMAIDLP